MGQNLKCLNTHIRYMLTDTGNESRNLDLGQIMKEF